MCTEGGRSSPPTSPAAPFALLVVDWGRCCVSISSLSAIHSSVYQQVCEVVEAEEKVRLGRGLVRECPVQCSIGVNF